MNHQAVNLATMNGFGSWTSSNLELLDRNQFPIYKFLIIFIFISHLLVVILSNLSQVSSTRTSSFTLIHPFSLPSSWNTSKRLQTLTKKHYLQVFFTIYGTWTLPRPWTFIWVVNHSTCGPWTPQAQPWAPFQPPNLLLALLWWVIIAS